MPTFVAVVRYAQPLLRERVLDRESERERIPGLRLENVLQHDAMRLALGHGPGGPAHEAVDRVPLLRLGEGEPVPLTVVLVAAVLEPVRPRDQHLAASRRGHLVGPVAVDDVATAGRVRAKPGADLDDDHYLGAVPDLDLLA